MKFKVLAIAASVAVCFAASANAAQIVVAPSSVIGSSGEEYDSPGFAAGHIFDQQSGVVSDSFDANYWLNKDNGPANAFITIDLGAKYSLSSAQLFNTHNGPYGDRGTGDFSIVAGNSVVLNVSTGQYQLTGPTMTVFSGALSAAPNADPITGQSFSALSGADYRYLEFLPTSVASANNSCCGANVYGLTELRLFGAAVPEPATWAMMLVGIGGVGAAMRARRKLSGAPVA